MSAAAPMWMVSDPCPAMICRAMDMAWLMGMAKPSVPAWNWNPLDAAVSMPMTTPSALTSGPPESPGFNEASVWMSPVSCSVLLSDCVAGGDGLVEIGDVPGRPTLGVPPTPPAFPTAVTPSPDGHVRGVPDVARS